MIPDSRSRTCTSTSSHRRRPRLDFANTAADPIRRARRERDRIRNGRSGSSGPPASRTDRWDARRRRPCSRPWSVTVVGLGGCWAAIASGGRRPGSDPFGAGGVADSRRAPPSRPARVVLAHQAAAQSPRRGDTGPCRGPRGPVPAQAGAAHQHPRHPGSGSSSDSSTRPGSTSPTPARWVRPHAEGRGLGSSPRPRRPVRRDASPP